MREFTSEDAKNPDYSCGQVLIANYLVDTNKILFQENAVKLIEQKYPPDVLFGYLGTSRSLIERAIFNYSSYSLQEYSSVTKLIEFTNKGFCPIVLITVWDGWLPKGHWTHLKSWNLISGEIELSNWGTVSEEEFLKSWKGITSILGGMRHKFLC